MQLLIDSDVFCKLGIAGLLEDGIAILGASLTTSGRLPALPHMLRRGSLVRTYGDAACVKLLPLTEAIPPIPAPDPTWLDKTAQVPSIDPGEAQLFASAAADGLLVLTGDKRALLALKDIEGFETALAGRIVVFEALLLALCDSLGAPEVTRRLRPLIPSDKTLRVCFSDSETDPREGLLSYFRNLATAAAPLLLWQPPLGWTE